MQRKQARTATQAVVVEAPTRLLAVHHAVVPARQVEEHVSALLAVPVGRLVEVFVRVVGTAVVVVVVVALRSRWSFARHELAVLALFDGSPRLVTVGEEEVVTIDRVVLEGRVVLHQQVVLVEDEQELSEKEKLMKESLMMMKKKHRQQQQQMVLAMMLGCWEKENAEEVREWWRLLVQTYAMTCARQMWWVAIGIVAQETPVLLAV